MLYFLLIDNQVQGPFSEEEIRTRVKAGTLRSTDLVCEEGGEQWEPINVLFVNLAYKLPSAPAPKVVADSANEANVNKLNNKSHLWDAFLSKFPQPLAIVYETGAKSALKFATPAAAIGGFVADVLQPIAPVSLYLFILSIICAIVSGMGAWLLRQKIESNMRRRSSLFCSFTTVCSILFGASWFLFTSNCPDKGFLATRVDAIDSMQASLLGVQQSVERVESTVTQVSADVGAIKSDVKDISQGVSGLGKMGGIITNPTTPVEFYNNALIFKERGDVASQRKALEAFVKTGEQKIEPFDMLIDVLKGMEGPEGAKKAYEDMIRRYPDNLMLQTYLFRLLEKKVAIDHLQSIIDQNPDFTPAYFIILGGGYDSPAPGYYISDLDDSLNFIFSSFPDKLHKAVPQWEKTQQWRKDVDEGAAQTVAHFRNKVNFLKTTRSTALNKFIAEIDSQKTDALEKPSELYATCLALIKNRPRRLFLYDSENSLYSDNMLSYWNVEHLLKCINEKIWQAQSENSEMIQEAENELRSAISSAIRMAEINAAREADRANRRKLVK